MKIATGGVSYTIGNAIYLNDDCGNAFLTRVCKAGSSCPDLIRKQALRSVLEGKCSCRVITKPKHYMRKSFCLP